MLSCSLIQQRALVSLSIFVRLPNFVSFIHQLFCQFEANFDLFIRSRQFQFVVHWIQQQCLFNSVFLTILSYLMASLTTTRRYLISALNSRSQHRPKYRCFCLIKLGLYRSHLRIKTHLDYCIQSPEFHLCGLQFVSLFQMRVHPTFNE